MIIAACSDKGSPGVTTLVTVLGMVWPYDCVVAEMDTAGGDLAFRLHPPAGAGRMLAAEPTVLSLAAGARAGVAHRSFPQYSQATSLGIPVVAGALSPEAFAPMARLWPSVAAEAARWPGTVLADLGRLQPGNPASVVAQAAAVVLLVARPTLEGLYHLRERVAELARLVGDPGREGTPVGVVMVCPARHERRVIADTAQMLDAAGSPARVVGILAEDRAGADTLWAGEVTRRLTGSDLLGSARTTAETLLRWWPQLAGPSPRGSSPAGLGYPPAVASGASR